MNRAHSSHIVEWDGHDHRLQWDIPEAEVFIGDDIVDGLGFAVLFHGQGKGAVVGQAAEPEVAEIVCLGTETVAALIVLEGALGADDDFFGNTSVNGEYLYDYTLYNASLGLGFSLFDMSMTVYGDYVENDDADDLETGWLAGIKLGSAKKKGSWQLQYQYEDLEADATLGLITDSDFMGGGTDGEGHKFSGKYMLNNNWYLGATYFDGNTGVDLGDDADYQRLMLDTGFKY